MSTNLDDERGYEDRSKQVVSDRRRKWSDEENELLRNGVEELGNQWAGIARRIKGRTGTDCKIRWERSLRPDLVKGLWTAQVSIIIEYILIELSY